MSSEKAQPMSEDVDVGLAMKNFRDVVEGFTQPIQENTQNFISEKIAFLAKDQEEFRKEVRGQLLNTATQRDLRSVQAGVQELVSVLGEVKKEVQFTSEKSAASLESELAPLATTRDVQLLRAQFEVCEKAIGEVRADLNPLGPALRALNQEQQTSRSDLREEQSHVRRQIERLGAQMESAAAARDSAESRLRVLAILNVVIAGLLVLLVLADLLRV